MMEDLKQYFRHTVVEPVKAFRRSSFRQIQHQFLNLALVVCSAIMIWQTLIFLTNSSSPVVVVLSGSMEPTMYKGDILFLANPSDTPFAIGDIVVYKIEGRDIPIVHRILEIHTDSNGQQMLLTKGDNNDGFDRPLYQPHTQQRTNGLVMWLRPDQVLGRAKAFLPYIGHLTIVMTEYPIIKFLLLATMGFFVITGKD